MPSLEEYFSQNSYKPKWFLGDRVYGKWNNIPFVGSVGNDSRIGGEDCTPLVSVLLDLPIKYRGTFHNVICVEHKQIKSLK